MRSHRSALTALVLGAALAAPTVAGAKPIQAFHVGDQPSAFKQNRCERWATKLNDLAHEVSMGRATQKDMDQAESKALDDGCAVIH